MQSAAIDSGVVSARMLVKVNDLGRIAAAEATAQRQGTAVAPRMPESVVVSALFATGASIEAVSLCFSFLTTEPSLKASWELGAMFRFGR